MTFNGEVVGGVVWGGRVAKCFIFTIVHEKKATHGFSPYVPLIVFNVIFSVNPVLILIISLSLSRHSLSPAAENIITVLVVFDVHKLVFVLAASIGTSRLYWYSRLYSYKGVTVLLPGRVIWKQM